MSHPLPTKSALADKTGFKTNTPILAGDAVAIFLSAALSAYALSATLPQRDLYFTIIPTSEPESIPLGAGTFRSP